MIRICKDLMLRRCIFRKTYQALVGGKRSLPNIGECVCVCQYSHKHACMHACIHTHIHTHNHTCIYEYTFALTCRVVSFMYLT